MTEGNRGTAGGADQLRKLAAFLGASGVALGALGAHALHDNLTRRGRLDNWRTATLYHLLHAVAVLGVSALCESKSSPQRAVGGKPHPAEERLVRAGQLMTVGTAMFSGSIYLLCFGYGPKMVLGPATPIGGLIMIGGCLMLI